MTPDHIVTSIRYVPADTIRLTNDNGPEGMIFAVALAVLVLLILAVGWYVVELRRRVRALGVAAVGKALE
ncbi:MAG: hypothetical protein NUV34_06220 [Sulfuricaulis sp.]|nr:hypothetical protein [Sulfuricaulis sp.]